jgi:hypothetical protein
MKVKTNLRAGAGSSATATKVKSSVLKPVVFMYNVGPAVPVVTQAWSRCAGI